MADADTASPVRLKDYETPAYRIPEIDLSFDLEPEATRVTSQMQVLRNRTDAGDLVLDGELLELIEISIDGRVLTAEEYELSDNQLVIPNSPESFQLTTVALINPDANKALSGLYRSSGNFCTQCEPEGFRRITWFIDRPDVLSSYTVTINADKTDYPVLLSNGDLIGQTELGNGRHQAKWHDPWPKPSYLFALVAGDLGCLEDRFVTLGGREVALKVYAQHHNMNQCDHAMASLKKSMSWDEQVYGREYDLDTYMIVVVDDFNMGAMENKGLNIFNSKYVLARPEIATDTDYDDIESVIGHEYFHNWSGNRVTCRDWFQLSLKEGFTVFRDQEFSADMGSRGVKRIEDVNVLRAAQFPEDGGPMAHPVRPDSYVEINNFYTVTIYNKGAEVVRMLHHLVGGDGFRQGCDLYFERHDGEAVTTDDFVKAHEDANNRRLTQFRRWYDQAGTPKVEVAIDYDSDTRKCRLDITQSCPDTPDQSEKLPFHIPLRTALFDKDGRTLTSRLSPASDATHEHVLELTEARQSFELEAVESPPVVSMLRGFSAPIKLNTGQNARQLGILMAHDNDPFNRWDSGQRLAMSQILAATETKHNTTPAFDEHYIEAYGTLLASAIEDGAFHAYALALPGYAIIAEECDPIDPMAIHAARQALMMKLAVAHRDVIEARYESLLTSAPYVYNYQQRGQRALKNRLLSLLGAGAIEGYETRCLEQYRAADNMTDRMGALSVLAENGAATALELLEDFYRQWKDYSLVVDKWLRLQSTSPTLGTLEHIHSLLQHEGYQPDNPNKIRALIGAFSHANPVQFHQPDGTGHDFLTEQVLKLDAKNPQIAARLVSAMNPWKRYAQPWSASMQSNLTRIQSQSGLSRDVSEIVNRCLESN